MRKLIESYKQLLPKLLVILSILMIAKISFEIIYKRAIINTEYSGTYLK